MQGSLEHASAGPPSEVSLDFSGRGHSPGYPRHVEGFCLGRVWVHPSFTPLPLPPKGLVEPLHTSPSAGDSRDKERTVAFLSCSPCVQVFQTEFGPFPSPSLAKCLVAGLPWESTWDGSDMGKGVLPPHLC